MAVDQNTKIAVTGGSGFIGTNVVQYYMDKGVNVLSLDCVEPKNSTHMDVFRNVDLLDAQRLCDVLNDFDPDFVIHLGARTDLDETVDISGYDANTEGVRNLLAATMKCNSLKRVIFTSSMLVCRFGYIPKNMQDYNPSTLYGESKVLTEKIIFEHDLPYSWLITRPSSIWGPWFGAPYRSFFEMVLSGRFLRLGKRAGTATYGYIGNVVYQIDSLLAAAGDEVDQKVFYLGDDPACQLSVWADEIAEIVGKKNMRMPYSLLKIAAVFGDLVSFLGIKFPITSFRLRNMTTDNILDLSATKAVAPSVPFTRKQGIQKTIEWLQGEQ